MDPGPRPSTDFRFVARAALLALRRTLRVTVGARFRDGDRAALDRSTDFVH